MIQVNLIAPPTVRLFGPNNQDLGMVNEYQLNDVRVQIKVAAATGYFVVDSESVTHNIDKDGRFETYPKCLELMTDQLTNLL
jgi:hypothetical protein